MAAVDVLREELYRAVLYAIAVLVFKLLAPMDRRVVIGIDVIHFGDRAQGFLGIEGIVWDGLQEGTLFIEELEGHAFALTERDVVVDGLHREFSFFCKLFNRIIVLRLVGAMCEKRKESCKRELVEGVLGLKTAIFVRVRVEVWQCDADVLVFLGSYGNPRVIENIHMGLLS